MTCTRLKDILEGSKTKLYHISEVKELVCDHVPNCEDCYSFYVNWFMGKKEGS